MLSFLTGSQLTRAERGPITYIIIMSMTIIIIIMSMTITIIIMLVTIIIIIITSRSVNCPGDSLGSLSPL